MSEGDAAWRKPRNKAQSVVGNLMIINDILSIVYKCSGCAIKRNLAA